jgi:hypothetical protein
MAAPLALRLDPTLPAAALTLVCGLGTLLLVYHWGMQNAKCKMQNTSHPPQPVIPFTFCPLHLFSPLFLALSAPFLLYTARGSGMETALFTLLLAAGGFAAQQARRPQGLLGVGALLALATLTRPDGALGALAAGVYLLVRNAKRKMRNAKGNMQHAESWSFATRPFTFYLLPFALFSCGYLAIFLPYYAWRYAYYGYPLPNTFYAKVGTGWAQVQRGLDYAAEFAGAIGWPFVALLLAAGLAAVRFRGSSFGFRVSGFRAFPHAATVAHLLLLIALYSAYTIAVGGDHFPGLRFFVPILPALALLLQMTLLEIGGWGLEIKWRKPLAYLSLALACVYLTWIAAALPASNARLAQSPVRGEYNVVEKNRELGYWLRDNTPRDTLVASGIAGAMPFYSGLRVIDTLGLNDLHIAHLEVQGMGSGIAGAEKTDVGYVLDRRPDYIPFSSSGAFEGHQRFRREYELIEVRGPEGRLMRLYRRR